MITARKLFFALALFAFASPWARAQYAFPPSAMVSAANLPISVTAAPYNAKGDGTTDDTAAIQAAIDAAFGTSGSPHGTSYWLNSPLYFPPGRYKITSALHFPPMQGARITGGGRFTTQITQATANASVMTTNGAAYSHWEGISLVGSGTAIVFDLNYDNNGVVPGLQSNSFTDMNFGGGNIGVRVGQGGYMGSETLWLNSFFSSNTVAGIETENQNAVDNTVIGGDFQGCGDGIHVVEGSVNTITGVSFQAQTGWDVHIEGSARDSYHISGCRTESPNFVKSGAAQVHISACSQVSGTSGYFWRATTNPGYGPSTVDAVISNLGVIKPDIQLIASIRNSSFGRSDWFDWVVADMQTGGISTAIERRGIEYDFNGTPAYIVHDLVIGDGTVSPGPSPIVLPYMIGANVNASSALQSLFLDPGTVNSANSSSYNTAVGWGALAAMATGNQNTAVGRGSCVVTTDSIGSTCIGMNAGASMHGNGNTLIGASVDSNTVQNVLALGYSILVRSNNIGVIGNDNNTDIYFGVSDTVSPVPHAGVHGKFVHSYPLADAANLPACAAGTEGTQFAVQNSNTNTWGATVAGGGSDHVLAYCDGTNWTVAAK